MNRLTSALKVHVALTVSDLEASVLFYRRLFGLEPLKLKPGYAKFDVQHPAVNLTLNLGMPATAGTLSHLGIQVPSTEDVVSIRDQWRDAGLEPREEMKTDCCYALQDKAWVRDPDGNEWEVFVVLKDTSSANTGCCSATPSLIRIGQ
jgi:catechol 2,3-dioxygenase-like lactoylglutathione lyase family enzyme